MKSFKFNILAIKTKCSQILSPCKIIFPILQHIRVSSSTIAHKVDINPPDKNAADKHVVLEQKTRNEEKKGEKKNDG